MKIMHSLLERVWNDVFYAKKRRKKSFTNPFDMISRALQSKVFSIIFWNGITPN